MSGFTTRINELSKSGSDALLEFLFKHVTRPEFQVRHRWQTNDLALWDNRNPARDHRLPPRTPDHLPLPLSDSSRARAWRLRLAANGFVPRAGRTA